MSDYFKKMDDMDKRISKAIKKRNNAEHLVVYSAYEQDEEGEPVDNLDETAVEGQCILVRYADEYWGGKKAKDYYSPVLTNPSWMEVAIHANEMIKVTNDFHHTFLEGLTESGEEKDGVLLYEFDMGS